MTIARMNPAVFLGENVYILISGTDFQVEESSRVAAGAWIVVGVAGGKILKFAGYLTKEAFIGTKSLINNSNKLYKLVKGDKGVKIAELSADEVARIGIKGESLVKINLGNFIKKIGDYEVYEGGEVFYRTMSKEHYEILLSTKKLSATGETFTSPTQIYSEGYKGYLVRISTQHGTIDKLKSIATTDGTPDVLRKFGQMPQSLSGWSQNKALFKSENGQVNIGLGKGDALNIFNDNINGIELIKIIE
jgi:hypothetical protein